MSTLEAQYEDQRKHASEVEIYKRMVGSVEYRNKLLIKAVKMLLRYSYHDKGCMGKECKCGLYDAIMELTTERWGDHGATDCFPWTDDDGKIKHFPTGGVSKAAVKKAVTKKRRSKK